MKVLFLITGLRLGGAEKQLLLLCQNLKKNGFEVAVAAMETGGILKQEFLDNGIPVNELDIKGLSSLFAGYRKFASLVKRFKPAVIHAHMIHANFLASIYKFFNGKNRLVITAHNITEGSKFLMYGYRLIKFIPDWATHVSLEAYESYIANNYFPQKRSSHISNAIDMTLFNPENFNKNNIRKAMGFDEEAFIFLAAGRLHHQKNYELLIKAFQQMKPENAFLLIAGEGPLEQGLRQLCTRLNVEDVVHFLGRRKDMASLFAMSDCFVLSSDFEGFGLVIAEAMAMKKQVIATDCGGVKEVLGGLGTLVEVNNLSAMAAALKFARQNTAVQEQEQMRIHIEKNYTIAKMVKQWQELYYSL